MVSKRHHMFQDPSERSSPETTGPAAGRPAVSIGVGGPNSLQNMQKLKDFRSKYSAQEICPPWEMDCEGETNDMDNQMNMGGAGLKRSMTLQNITLHTNLHSNVDKMLAEPTDIQPRNLKLEPSSDIFLGKRSLESTEPTTATKDTKVRRVQSLNLDHFSTSALRHITAQEQTSEPALTPKERSPVEQSPIKPHELTQAWQQGLLDGLQLSGQVLQVLKSKIHQTDLFPSK